MATKYLSAAPKFQAFDSNGDPLSGGFLTFYEAGTTTPATTYSNSAGTSNASPIVLDARGEASVYLTAGLKYDVRLTSSTGVLVWTATRLSAPVTPSAYFTTLMDETTQTALFNIVVAPSGTVTGDWNFEDAAFNFAARVTLASATTTNIGAAASNSVTINPTYTYFAWTGTWNPSQVSSHIALSGSDLVATQDSSAFFCNVIGTASHTSGGWYAEFTITAIGSGVVVGFSSLSTILADGARLGANTQAYGYQNTGTKLFNAGGGAGTAYGASFTTGDVISLLLDYTADTINFWKNGVDQGVAFTGVGATLATAYIGVSLNDDAIVTAKFSAPFTYTPP